ncbi:MAG: TIGR04086 family membrane protein [Lachnospiraceae bacterium]|nr:TIGR04086 family membrane protein [Lachnospiraceae bacterium]
MNVSGSKVLLRSLLAAYLLSGVLLLILSFALYKLKLEEAQIDAAVYGVYVIACLFGGFLAGKAALSRRFFWGMLTGILYFAVLFAISWLMNRQTVPVPDLTRAATVLACCAVGGTAGGMFS